MLYRTLDKASGKKLYRSRPLLIEPKDAYVRPSEGAAWFKTTTSVWRVDELIRRSVRDWRRLTDETGHTGARNETFRKDHDSAYTGSYSVFPAPLMEWIILRYGGPPGAKILDAFAGGAVRAVVSSIMGMEYYGIELRREQITENLTVLKKLGLDNCTYYEDDGRFFKLDRLFDVGITCPPYHDLEVYSDRPDDLSNLGSYDEFNASMCFNAMAYYEHLKPGAFMCIVVGPFRNKKTGELIDFPAHTVCNYREAGFIYWQQIVLSKNFASAATRSTNAWKGQKLVPSHEFLLVFRKPKE